MKTFFKQLMITCFVSIASCLTISAQNLTNSLISVWEFDGNANDSHGSYNGTVNGATYTSSGKISGCYDFDGTNDYINSSIDPANQLGQEFTISAWIYPKSSGNYRGVAGAHIGSHSGFTFLQYESGAWRSFYGNGSSWVNSATTTVTLNQWNYVVVEYKGESHIKTYINGVLESNVNQTSKIKHYSAFWIGRAFNTNDRYFNGKIDQLAIWNRTLTEDEISQLYNNGNGLAYSNWNSTGCTADNLGNHTATKNIKLNSHWLTNDGGNEGIRIDNSGNVGINTTKFNDYDLAVGGKIHAEEVVVETDWADYVFKEDYDLKPLKDVDQYIKTNGHLPGIPSAKEVDANGIGLAEMNMLLLKKVEELTLYTLKQEKKIRKLETENKQIKLLEERIDRLEKTMSKN